MDNTEAGLFIVTVWDMIEGDIHKKIWEATQNEADEVQDQYEDDPRYNVVVEEGPGWVTK